jgi:hypothetical protein
MRPSRDLVKLRRQAIGFLGRLRVDVASVASDFSPHSRKVIGQVTIDLLNNWSIFSRSYYLSCILRPKRERGGRVIATTFPGNGFNDAIGLAIRRYRPSRTPLPNGSWDRRDEPPWHDINVLLTSCAGLGCSNLAQIQASLSTGTTVFNRLPAFRNFFAHRNEASARSALTQAGGFRNSSSIRPHPADILRSPPLTRPFPLLLEWIHDVEITVQWMCE